MQSDRPPPTTLRVVRSSPSERPAPASPLDDLGAEFALETAEGTGSCRQVLGFAEAALAAQDPRAQAPLRLGLVEPDAEAASFLARWSEDVDQVRRRIGVRRADGLRVTVLATLAAYGGGVQTSLSVESICPRGGGALLRSGVHTHAEVEAALALLETAGDDRVGGGGDHVRGSADGPWPGS